MSTHPQKAKAVVIYGASSENIADNFKSEVFRLGQLLAKGDYSVVSGGGKAGLMRAAIEGAASVGGETIGVLPEFMIKRDWQHPSLSRMIVTDGMHERKRTMAELSCGAVACPGGCGTLEELLEIITWRQLGLFTGNVVILNIDHYYDPLLEMLQRTIDMGFMHPDHASLWCVATNAEEAYEAVTAEVTHIDFSQKIH
ncbi:MAG: TIGR00730 family Rossman fold protein [Paramuribaculum sp.]|nr:TIGR00730 family Rossman fold protein [Paramuribaculum sp.]